MTEEAARRPPLHRWTPCLPAGLIRREIDADAPAVQCRVVHGLLSSAGCIRRHKGDEAEATGPAGVAVLDDTSLRDLAVHGEGLAERLVGGGPGKTPNKQLIAHSTLLLGACASKSAGGNSPDQPAEKVAGGPRPIRGRRFWHRLLLRAGKAFTSTRRDISNPGHGTTRTRERTIAHAPLRVNSCR